MSSLDLEFVLRFSYLAQDGFASKILRKARFTLKIRRLDIALRKGFSEKSEVISVRAS